MFLNYYYFRDLENGTTTIDPSLEDIVNKMMDRCMDYGQYRQALGVAIETKRLYVFNVCTDSSYNMK